MTDSGNYRSLSKAAGKKGPTPAATQNNKEKKDSKTTTTSKPAVASEDEGIADSTV